MYVGRFAPSPTGPLHLGSLSTALASWLDARAHGGRWLVRIEDTDFRRCRPSHGHFILRQLASCGLHPDAPVQWQSEHVHRYQQAFDQLYRAGLIYPCSCSRRDIERACEDRPFVQLSYPGSCRPQNGGPKGPGPRSWRLNLPRLRQHASSAHPALLVRWCDRRLGAQVQDVPVCVGDFVLRRADGVWAYQLAVVVDDGQQGVSSVVRGSDLLDNTPRQLLLQSALGLPHPSYLHISLITGPDGRKLSKQNHAPMLAPSTPVQNLRAAARHLGLAGGRSDRSTAELLARWVAQWAERHAREAITEPEYPPQAAV